MKSLIASLLTLLMLATGQCSVAQIEHVYQHNESLTYEQAIGSFTKLANSSEFIRIEEHGKTDVGRPLHLVIFDASGEFRIDKQATRDKVVILINNAIHPGESCGVDASVLLFEYLKNHADDFQNVIVCAIPVYNIGGMLNRSPYNRSGQPGPLECGFRGNYKNLDLNRDFIKMDSKNAKSFVRIFHLLDPDIFIDTHTTNGSDHQYTLTLITSQRDKMNPKLQGLVFDEMEPALYGAMYKKGKPMIPYVYMRGKTPDDKGLKDFMETPRYSSGYANVFDCISFITEAHKYKTFTKRVEHTYEFLLSLSVYADKNHDKIRKVRSEAKDYSLSQSSFVGGWSLDTTKSAIMDFKGYEYRMKKSEVTGQEFLVYDSESPKTFLIPYYRAYSSSFSVDAPRYYVVPQAYTMVLERLKLNGVSMQILGNDSVIQGVHYYIEDFNTSERPYENHYFHPNVQVRRAEMKTQFYSGDVLIDTEQSARRLIVETLEPQFADSYFNWNFFDNILQQKEWFSSFAFEPIAADLLKENEELSSIFENKKSNDNKFANDHFAQLYWIFKRSPYYEKTHNRYPVMRIE